MLERTCGSRFHCFLNLSLCFSALSLLLKGLNTVFIVSCTFSIFEYLVLSQSCPTVCNPMDCSLPGSSVHGDSPGKNTGMGCHAAIQGIFPTQGSNPGLPHCRRTVPSKPPGNPWILQWVAYPFSRWSSWPRNQMSLLHYRWILHQLSYQGSPELILFISTLVSITLLVPGYSLWNLVQCIISDVLGFEHSSPNLSRNKIRDNAFL